MNREQKPEPSVERAAHLAMHPELMTEDERADKRAREAEGDKRIAEYRRQRRWDYLRSKEFRANVWSTLAGVGALCVGLIALDHPDGGGVLFIYVLIASLAITAVVHKINSA